MWEQKKQECGAPCSIVLCLERQEMTIPEPIEGWPRSNFDLFFFQIICGLWKMESLFGSLIPFHNLTEHQVPTPCFVATEQITWDLWNRLKYMTSDIIIFFVLFCSSVLCDIMLSSMLIPSWSISRIVSCLSKTSRPWAILTKNVIFNGGESTLKCIDISCSVFFHYHYRHHHYIQWWESAGDKSPTFIITVKTPPWWGFDWWECAGEPIW